MWKKTEGLKLEILKFLRHDNAGIRTMAIKFVEQLVLAYSLETGDSEKPPHADKVSLDIVPLGHPFLDREDLRLEGQAHVDTLASLLNDPTQTSANIITLVGSLAQIARQRPTFMSRVISALVALHKTPPAHLNPSQAASLSRSLKLQLITLLKHDSSADFHDTLVPVLEELDTDMAVLHQFDKRGQGRRRHAAPADGAPPAKRVATESAPAGSARAMPPHLTAETLQQRLPLQRLVELLLVSLRNLPDTFPAEAYAAPAASGASGPPPPQAPEADAAATAAAAATTTAAPPAAAAPGSAPRKRFLSISADDDTPTGAVAKKIKIEPELNVARPTAPSRKGPFKLQPQPLEPEQRVRMVVAAFDRVLQAGGRMTEAGSSRAHVMLLARLCASVPLPELIELLVRYIAEDVRHRAELAILWLYHEFHASPLAEPRFFHNQKRRDEIPACAFSIFLIYLLSLTHIFYSYLFAF